jgi:hypothetical protein
MEVTVLQITMYFIVLRTFVGCWLLIEYTIERHHAYAMLVHRLQSYITAMYGPVQSPYLFQPLLFNLNKVFCMMNQFLIHLHYAANTACYLWLSCIE